MHLLVVEDDVGNQHLLQAVLGSAGYTVHMAASGQQALTLLPLHRPDVVILDFLLPDTTAPQLIEQLRLQGCAAPVLLVSGTITPEARHATQQAAGYLMKPYDIDALLDAIAAVRGTAAAPDTPRRLWPPGG